MTKPPSTPREFVGEPDPAFINGRREAIIIVSVWLCAMLWAVPFCYLNGYPDVFDADTMPTVLGVPAWVFWGIGFPWLVADVFTIYFCTCYMRDDDLGAAEDASPLASGDAGSDSEGGA